MWTNRDRGAVADTAVEEDVGPAPRTAPVRGGEFDDTVAGADDRARTGFLRSLSGGGRRLRRRCRRSRLPRQAPFSARGPIVLLNGGVRNGTLSLFVHTYVSVPAPTAVVVPVKITRIHRGHFGIHAVAAVPRSPAAPARSPSSASKSAAGSPTGTRSRPSSPPPARQGSTTPKATSNSRADNPPRHPPSALHPEGLVRAQAEPGRVRQFLGLGLGWWLFKGPQSQARTHSCAGPSHMREALRAGSGRSEP